VGAFETILALLLLAFLACLVSKARERTDFNDPSVRQRFATPEQKRLVFRRDGGRCRHCGRQVIRTRHPVPEQASFDHVEPWSWGGPTTMSNLQLLCRECNTAKGARYSG
jgi:5-methylcytosine-specific restriction endonuclease McrA